MMKKTKYMSNAQRNEYFDNSPTQKKEDKNNSLISFHENMNLHNIYKSGTSIINIPSNISSRAQILPSNYPITPLRSVNHIISSSNRNKNFQSSGLIWNKTKDFNYNNMINNNDNYSKRKLLAEFDKSSGLSKSIINREQIKSQNFNFDFDTFSQIENNNNLALFTPPNLKKEKENEIYKEKIKAEYKNNSANTSEINQNKGTTNNKLFFTDYGFGYKCNCTKTGCNKFYCQCFNQGRYCHGCNCINCNNKKPDYISSNKRPKESEEKNKTILISCTCTKSGCNKNYCECYKNKTKCNNLCRCRNCENSENYIDSEKIKEHQNMNYECCEANSVFIIKNKIIVEDISKKYVGKQKIMANESSLSSSSTENRIIGKKIKRKNFENEKNLSSSTKSKINEDCSDEDMKAKKNDYTRSDLFDKEGKLILTNIKL